MILQEQLTSFFKDPDVSHTDLGHWSWCLVDGEPDHHTHVLTSYPPAEIHPQASQQSFNSSYAICRQGTTHEPKSDI